MRKLIEYSADEIKHILDQYIHDIQDRNIMIKYLTDYPGSMERLSEMCEVSTSTVKRAINRCSYVYKYFPDRYEL